MTPQGTFIINGVERAVVNQIVRSPGVYFGSELDAATGKLLYTAELRPIRGTWLEFEISKTDVISIRVDRRRKFLATTILRAMGLSDELFPFGLEATVAKDTTKTVEEALIEIYKKMRPGEPIVLENAQNFFMICFLIPAARSGNSRPLQNQQASGHGFRLPGSDPRRLSLHYQIPDRPLKARAKPTISTTWPTAASAG